MTLTQSWSGFSGGGLVSSFTTQQSRPEKGRSDDGGDYKYEYFPKPAVQVRDGFPPMKNPVRHVLAITAIALT
jgi:hypothetical protein